MGNRVILDGIAFKPDTDTLLNRLGVTAHGDIADEVMALVASAREVASPKVVLREVLVGELGDKTVEIEGVSFTSSALRSHLEGVDKAYAYVATCGAELEALQEGVVDPFLRYAVDCIMETALFAAIERFDSYLRDVAGLEKTASMNPGSGDVSVWPIKQQRELFRLIGDVDVAVGVRLTGSCLMQPNKSVSGIAFPTDSDFVSCQLCKRAGCPNRRAEYDEHLSRLRQGGDPE